MKKLSLIFIFACLTTLAFSQIYYTKSGKISFYSEAPLEKIEAHNSNATSVLNLEDGSMEFAVLIKAFQFEKALMQEHFNENYMESAKYPKAIFKGKIVNYKPIDLSKDGEYPVRVAGDLTIHGVTNPVETDAMLKVKGGKITGNAVFTVKVADYKIEIPSVVRDNIAKEVEITVDVDYQRLEK